MKFKAVIFDMDGVLIDSESHWVKSEMAFLRKYNITLTREMVAQMTGRSLRESVEILKKEFSLSQSIEELLGEKMKASEDIYTYQAQAKPGVEALLKILERHPVKIAIASGSMLSRIEKIVDRFGWRQYFDKLISADHVNFIGKPDPAIYRHTSEVLGVRPEQCVVIEDSFNGINAAKSAGMYCLAVPDARWSDGDFSAADWRVESLEDKNVLHLLGLS